MMKLLSNQLSLYYPTQYEPYIGIPKIINSIFSLCCNYIKEIEIDIIKLKNKCENLEKIFLLNECNMINMIVFTALFPNCKELILCNIEIDDKITKYLTNLKNKDDLFINSSSCHIQFKNKIEIDTVVTFKVDELGSNDWKLKEEKDVENDTKPQESEGSNDDIEEEKHIFDTPKSPAVVEEKPKPKLQGEARFEFIRELSETLQGRIYLVKDLNNNGENVWLKKHGNSWFIQVDQEQMSVFQRISYQKGV